MGVDGRGPPRRNLWRTVVLGLLAPFVVAGAIVTYNLLRLETVERRITHLERADDINLTLLELRRYEKNILLFRDEGDVRSFFEHLGTLRRHVRSIENDALSAMSGGTYRSLVEALGQYEKAARALVEGVATQQRLEGDIRPLGRALEKATAHPQLAFEIRRSEKNYLIYREPEAVKKLRARVDDLARMQPSVAPVLKAYLGTFDAIVGNREEKERALDAMRSRGREIQKIAMELSGWERKDIDHTLSMSKRLSVASLIFLAVSLYAVGYLFSRRVRTTLHRVEEALAGLESGSFAHISVDGVQPPAEIASLISTYNHTIDALGASRAELERNKAELEANMERLEEVNREIVERQDEIIEARKLSAMRLLASEIAHEVSNPLSSLILSLGVMVEDVPPDDPRREKLGLLLAEATRCQQIVTELVSFAKKEALAFRTVDPARLVSDAIEVVQRQNRARQVALVTSLGGLPSSAVVDPILIQQAFVNVIANAFQSTPDGGRVEVRGLAERDCMTFTIRDDGCGISSEDLAHVFEPFFSTRKNGGGSGLGLAITQKIIERHHGTIRARSKPGETVFTIELPIERERACRPER